MRIISAGTISALFPAATRTIIAAISAWKISTGGSEMVCVRYSGTAASIGSRRSSISRRLALIGTSGVEDDAGALDGQRHRLVRRLQQRQRAEDAAGAVESRAESEVRDFEDDVELTLDGVVDRR